MLNRIYQVLGLITLFRLPVYSTIHARIVNDSTVIGEVDMALIQGVSGDWATEKNGCVRYSRVWQIMGYGVCPWGHICVRIKGTSCSYSTVCEDVRVLWGEIKYQEERARQPAS